MQFDIPALTRKWICKINSTRGNYDNEVPALL